MIAVLLVFGVAFTMITGDVTCSSDPNFRYENGGYTTDADWKGECQVKKGPVTLTPIGSKSLIKIGD